MGVVSAVIGSAYKSPKGRQGPDYLVEFHCPGGLKCAVPGAGNTRLGLMPGQELVSFPALAPSTPSHYCFGTGSHCVAPTGLELAV